MITPLDLNPWSAELYGGNAAFVRVPGSVSPPSTDILYVVSQVRPHDNSFVVLKSNPVPPDCGPGWSFTQVASYTFPSVNESFDPVVAYDSDTYLLHIVGVQDNRSGAGESPTSTQEPFPVDLLKFTFNTLTDVLSGPAVLLTSSYVREGYDICPIPSSGGHQFVAVAVTDPLLVDNIVTEVQVTEVSISDNVLIVTGANGLLPGMDVMFSGLQAAQFLNGVSVTLDWASSTQFTATYAYPGSYSQGAGVYESGSASWLPGHSLLGFELDEADIPVDLPIPLASSPFRSGSVFGSSSVCSPDASTVEVYYESHAKSVSFQDQSHTVNQLVRSLGIWGPETVLTTFNGRYTDGRLTVVPVGITRTVTLVFFTQDVRPNSIIGNILVGYFDGLVPSPPVPWLWKANSGSGLGGSVVQATPSVSLTQGTSVAYLLEPVYSMHGAWSYSVLTTKPEWQTSYVQYDRVSFDGSDYVCILPLRNRGWWSSQGSYLEDDITASPVYYEAILDITGNVEALPPPQDSGSWSLLTETPLGVVAAWDPSANYLAGSVVKVPSYYTSTGPVSGEFLSPPLDPDNWTPLLTPPTDTVHWVLAPTSWPLYVGSLDLSSLSIGDSSTYGDLSLTWLRGTKSVLDNDTKWAVLGEAAVDEDGDNTPYYVSHFNVPPTAALTPLGGSVWRGTPFSLDASGTYDPDTGDAIQFTWSIVPADPNITLTSIAPGTQALLVNRAIGGAEVPLSAAVVAVDFLGGTPNHPPMSVVGAAYDLGTNIVTVFSNIANLAAGEEVLLYGLQTATFLNNAVVTVISTGTSLSPPSVEFSGTVQFATPAQQALALDYPATSDIGFAIATPQFAVTPFPSSSPPQGLVVPFNPQPTITMPSLSPAARNSSVTISPVITGDVDYDDDTTYTWTQTHGTLVQVTGDYSATLTLTTNGALVEGETLEWSLTVDDGVNPPVTENVSLDVLPYDFSITDTLRLSRGLWPGTIAARNSVQTWGGLDVSFIYTDFSGVKRTSILDGTDRYVIMSPYSVLLYDKETHSVLRKLLLPDSVLILDAVHTEEDYTLVLGADGKLYRFTSAPAVNTDNPDVTIDLSEVSGLRFTTVFCTVGYAGSRVIVLSGPDGCLLLQVLSSDLTVQGMLELSMVSKMVYGANNVQFARVANVENMRSGKVLLGTISNEGETFETLIDLSQGRIIGTWDASKLVNQHTTSGEILFDPENSYSGKPLAPILSTPTDNGASTFMPNLEMVGLSWAQVRPDLCSGYIIQSSIDSGATWQLATTVGSGAIESLVLSLARGYTYLFRVQAVSGDGVSGQSNYASIAI